MRTKKTVSLDLINFIELNEIFLLESIQMNQFLVI